MSYSEGSYLVFEREKNCRNLVNSKRIKQPQNKRSKKEIDLLSNNEYECFSADDSAYCHETSFKNTDSPNNDWRTEVLDIVILMDFYISKIILGLIVRSYILIIP